MKNLIFLFVGLTYYNFCQSKFVPSLTERCHKYKDLAESMTVVTEPWTDDELHISFRTPQREEDSVNLYPVEDPIFADDAAAWLAKFDGNSTSFRRFDLSSLEGSYYVNRNRKASFNVYEEFANKVYDGFYDEGKDHVIIKSVPDDGDHVSFHVDGIPGRMSAARGSSRQKRSKMSKPLDIFEPELLIIVDQELYRNLMGHENVVRYVGTYWNAINMKFSEFETPKVRIKITGIIIDRDGHFLTYINQAKNGSAINLEKALDNSDIFVRKYLRSELNFTKYDAVITMTGLDSDNNLLGVAHIGGVCSFFRNVAMIIDDGCYTYNNIGAHELGHLLGMEHNNENDCSAKRSWSVGSTMNEFFELDVTSYEWTECNRRDIQEFAWSTKSRCLKPRK